MELALARFEQYLNRRFGQSSTPKHYLSDLRIFIRIVGDKAAEDVTPADIDAFVDDQIGRGLSPATVNRRLGCIHSFFEYLAAERPERYWPNPVINRRHMLKRSSRLPRDASDEAVGKIFAVISDERDRAMFGLMVGASLRVGEVSTLQLDDIEEPISPGSLAKLRVHGKGDKERVVWLTPSLWRGLQDWLEKRPSVTSDRIFFNWRNQPITVSGIQYRFKQHCLTAVVQASCHELRHTFARRLVEAGLPVDSLSKLLGHSHLHTTQRYIDGADPTVRADFAAAMARLENMLIQDRIADSEPPKAIPPGKPTMASPAQLEKLRRRLADSSLPPWLRDALEAYFSWRWPTWRPQTAYRIASNMINVIRRVWAWLAANRQIEGWETFRRSDLEAWLQARCQDGVSQNTIDYNLGLVRMLLRFVEARGCHLDPGLFRAESPKKRRVSLPRYLPDEGRVFVLHQRSPTPRTIQRRLRKYGTKAGVDVSPHKLRHTLATRLLNQGMPIHSLRKLLGHQHLNTTQIYARIYDQTLYQQFREATARLEGLAVDEWPQTSTGALVRVDMELAWAHNT